MLPINVPSANTESFISRITSKEVIQPTVTLTLLFFFQNWTGFVATIFYGVDIFMVSIPCGKCFPDLKSSFLEEYCFSKFYSLRKEAKTAKKPFYKSA